MALTLQKFLPHLHETWDDSSAVCAVLDAEITDASLREMQHVLKKTQHWRHTVSRNYVGYIGTLLSTGTVWELCGVKRCPALKQEEEECDNIAYVSSTCLMRPPSWAATCLVRPHYQCPDRHNSTLKYLWSAATCNERTLLPGPEGVCSWQVLLYVYTCMHIDYEAFSVAPTGWVPTGWII